VVADGHVYFVAQDTDRGSRALRRVVVGGTLTAVAQRCVRDAANGRELQCPEPSPSGGVARGAVAGG
jgi:hypothetical protein